MMVTNADSSDAEARDATVVDFLEDGDATDDAGNSIKGFTKYDKQDMHRMGKQQELMRNFRQLSSFSFTVILTATWEYLLVANTQALTNGGLAGVWWGFIWTFVGFGLIMISLAEMASMAPTSGGLQYQRGLSYLTGWMSTLSWQAGNASGSFLTGSLIQALISINNPSYQPTDFEYQWQGTLFVFSMVLVLYCANVWLAKQMPLIQNALLLLHVGTFVAVIAVLWARAPHNSADEVFTGFTNMGNWPSLGVSVMIGQITAIYGSIGSDAIAHMSEEVSNAGLSVPRAMFWSYTFNGALTIILLTAYVFSIASVEDALSDPTEFPFIYVFNLALSPSGVNALIILIFLLIVAANIDYNASTARQTFAFARDNGFPFHAWISRVHPTLHIPRNAIALTCTISCLLALINIGSSIAFNAVISLQVVALMFSYTISIACVLYRRIAHPETLPAARWSLGRWGIPINTVAVAYSLFAFFWAFWPAQTPVDSSTFNWGLVMYVGVAIFCGIMYVLQGRKIYSGPVTLVQNRSEAANGTQASIEIQN